MPRGRKNWYWCPNCRQWTVTMDVDEGTTPYMLGCQASIGCSGMAVSQLYPDISPLGAPNEVMVEFYKPSRIEYLMLQPELKQHVDQGGLLPRKAGNLTSYLIPN